MSEKVLDAVEIIQMEIIYIHIFITAIEFSAVFLLAASTRAMAPTPLVRQPASKFPAHTGAMRL